MSSVLLHLIYLVILIYHHRLPIFDLIGFKLAIVKQMFSFLLYPTYLVMLIGHRRLTIFDLYGFELAI
jgi:hypothetical protein